MNNPIAIALYSADWGAKQVLFSSVEFREFFETSPQIGKTYTIPHYSTSPQFGTPTFKVLSRMGGTYAGAWNLPDEFVNLSGFIVQYESGAE